MKMLINDLRESIFFNILYGYPKYNSIGIDGTYYYLEKYSPDYLASILISIFAVFYRANSRLWQRMNCDDYRVECNRNNWCKAISNIDNDYLVIATGCRFRVSSPQTCVELQRYIKNRHDKEIQLLNIPHDVRKYLMKIISNGN